MLKHYNQRLDETYYTAQLTNGLHVIIFHKPEYHSSTAAFATPYGALNLDQTKDGRKYHFHPGVAHFLEHKLFESDHGDVMNEFFAQGANVNAFTSYRETVYYFSLPGDDIAKPLNLLLDFVQSLNITETSVENEKDIIVQELKMYLTMPDSRMINETFKALYGAYPLKYDIGGDEESVRKITKDELSECYAINYHPSNMTLVITTYLDPQMIMEIIETNQNGKTFANSKAPVTIFEKEDIQVVNKDVDIPFNLYNPKHVYGIKLQPNFTSRKECVKSEWAMRMLLECQFSALNPQYQNWMDRGLINDFFGYEVEFDQAAAYVLFYGEGRTKEDLKTLIDTSLRELLIDEDLLAQLKRRFAGMTFAAFNEIENFTLGYTRDIINGNDLFETIALIEEISLDYVKEIYQSFSYDNYSLVSLLPLH